MGNTWFNTAIIAARLCHANAVLLAEDNAADTVRICSANNLCKAASVAAATDDVVFRRKLFKHHNRIPVSLFFLLVLHPDKSPPSKPPPAESPPFFCFII